MHQAEVADPTLEEAVVATHPAVVADIMGNPAEN